MMELILKQGEMGLTQDPLILNQEYDVYRDGEYLGVAKYLNDEIHGNGFFSDMHGTRKVFVVDEWIIISS